MSNEQGRVGSADESSIMVMSDNRKLVNRMTPIKLGGIIITNITNRKVLIAISVEIKRRLHSKKDSSGLGA